MKKLALSFLFALLACCTAQAQSVVRVNAQAVATCGGQSLTAGIFYPVTIDLTGTLCVASGAGGITAAVTVANGADVAEGNTADAAATAGGTGTVSAKLRLMTTQLDSIATSVAAAPAPSSSATVGITPVVSASAESGHVLKATPGNAYSAYATNFTSTAGYFILLNSTTVPVDGAVTPLACALLAPNGVASINYAPGPPGVFSTGITAVVTSAANCFTKTTGVITAFISGSVK